MRTRLLAAAASRLSPGAVLPLIERAERADAGMYDSDPDAAPGMAADEHGHARTIAKLIEGGCPSPRAQIARREPWHRSDRSGALRAGVFGVSDGLVSNTALVIGVAGSGTSHTVILLAGTAGLLSAAISSLLTFAVGALVVILPTSSAAARPRCPPRSFSRQPPCWGLARESGC